MNISIAQAAPKALEMHQYLNQLEDNDKSLDKTNRNLIISQLARYIANPEKDNSVDERLNRLLGKKIKQLKQQTGYLGSLLTYIDKGYTKGKEELESKKFMLNCLKTLNEMKKNKSTSAIKTQALPAANSPSSSKVEEQKANTVKLQNNEPLKPEVKTEEKAALTATNLQGPANPVKENTGAPAKKINPLAALIQGKKVEKEKQTFKIPEPEGGAKEIKDQPKELTGLKLSDDAPKIVTSDNKELKLNDEQIAQIQKYIEGMKAVLSPLKAAINEEALLEKKLNELKINQKALEDEITNNEKVIVKLEEDDPVCNLKLHYNKNEAPEDVPFFTSDALEKHNANAKEKGEIILDETYLKSYALKEVNKYKESLKADKEPIDKKIESIEKKLKNIRATYVTPEKSSISKEYQPTLTYRELEVRRWENALKNHLNPQASKPIANKEIDVKPAEENQNIDPQEAQMQQIKKLNGNMTIAIMRKKGGMFKGKLST